MYGVVVLAVFSSNFYGLSKFILILGCGAYFIYLKHLETPGSACVQIQYLEQQWRIYKTPRQFEIHQTARMKFDFGWLMWLVLEGESTQHILLFRDQINPDDHRLLRVLLRALD
jgi:hypothetical protein